MGPRRDDGGEDLWWEKDDKIVGYIRSLVDKWGKEDAKSALRLSIMDGHLDEEKLTVVGNA